MLFGGERAFVSVATFLALVPGVTGDFFRKAYYFLTLDRFATSAGVGFGSYFSHRQAQMGAKSSCGSYCVLGCCAIGEGVLMGSHVLILSGKGQHVYDEAGRLADGTYAQITIGEHTWVGSGAIIMASVGQGCIIGAGAVVTKKVENNCLVAGNPARVIRKLDTPPTDQ